MDKFLEAWGKVPGIAKFAIIPVIWIGCGAFYYFMQMPDQENRYKSLANQFRTARKEREALEQIRLNLPRMLAEKKRLEEQLIRASKLLPAANEIPILLKRIDSIAKDAHLDLKRFRPRNFKASGLYGRKPIEMQVEGSFSELMDFFHKISSLDRIVDIVRLRLGSPRFKNQKMVMNASFKLVTYRFTGKKKKKKKKKA